MLRMKKDMGGAALVLGVAELVMRLGLPVRLLVLVGAVENAVAGNAFRPLDVLRTRAGLTVEVGNTDAEGRLVLADLLAFAAEREPELLVDCATLTGAARVALGPDLPAMMTPDDALAAALLAAGETTADPVWRLPLHGGLRFLARQRHRRHEQRGSTADGGCDHRRFILASFRPGGYALGPPRRLCLERQHPAGTARGWRGAGTAGLVGTIETLFGGIPGPGR